MSGGRRRAEKPQKRGGGEVARLVRLGVGLVVCAGAWVFLVSAAIDFGQAARSGTTLAWVFTAVATVGAIGCLLLVFMVAARLARALGYFAEYQGRRTGGKRSR